MMKTNETHKKDLPPDEIINFLNLIMRREIANPLERKGDELWVTLADKKRVRILAPQVSRDTEPLKRTEARLLNIDTVRHVLQHDYGYDEDTLPEDLHKLTLRNFEDCRMYIEEAIVSQLVVYYTNGLIEFIRNGEKYMLTLELKD